MFNKGYGLFRRNERGVSAVEYGIIIALVAAVIIGSVAAFGAITRDRAFQPVVDELVANIDLEGSGPGGWSWPDGYDDSWWRDSFEYTYWVSTGPWWWQGYYETVTVTVPPLDDLDFWGPGPDENNPNPPPDWWGEEPWYWYWPDWGSWWTGPP